MLRIEIDAGKRNDVELLVSDTTTVINVSLSSLFSSQLVSRLFSVLPITHISIVQLICRHSKRERERESLSSRMKTKQ